jgi:hypothetical protein
MSTHDERCEGDGCRCFSRKLRTVQFGGVEPTPESVMDRRREKDLPAFKRMRIDGLMPRTTTNAYELETRANDQLEINLGKLIDPKLLKTHRGEIGEAMAMARDAGFTTDDVAGWKQKRDADAT